MKKLLYINEQGDCEYINFPITRFECGHYFGCINISNPNHYGGDIPSYDEVETALPESVFELLKKAENIIKEAGYNIEKDSEKYNSIYNQLSEIDKELEKAFENESYLDWVSEVIDREIEYICDTYDINEEEALKVMDKYTGDSAYMDRNIICMIYDNYEDLGINEARNLFDVPNELDDYIDYERLGEDLAESSDYYVLDDGRIILYQEL